LRQAFHQEDVVECALEPNPPREVVADSEAVDPDEDDPDGADDTLRDCDGLLADTAG